MELLEEPDTRRSILSLAPDGKAALEYRALANEVTACLRVPHLVVAAT